MSIWIYKYESSDATLTETLIRNRTCICAFCNISMVKVQGKPLDNPDFPRHFTERKILCCPVCGWWVLREDVHGTDNAGAYAFTNTYGAIGSLKELDVSDSSAPIDDAGPPAFKAIIEQIGFASSFQETHGYYDDAVGLATVVLPAGVLAGAPRAVDGRGREDARLLPGSSRHLRQQADGRQGEGFHVH